MEPPDSWTPDAEADADRVPLETAAVNFTDAFAGSS